MTDEPADNRPNRRLDSWKEIAAFFGRDERTVRRWEKERALPVHRLPGGGRGTVFAYSVELSAWLNSSIPKSDSGSHSIPHSVQTADLSPLDATPVLAPLPVPPPQPRFTWRHRALALASIAIVIGVSGFFRFFQIRSVQGRALPSIALRSRSAAHDQAHELYLQGRYHWNKRTASELNQALDDFTRATQLDPNYALAYAGMADCYNLLREYTSMPASQAFPLALQSASKALQLDENLPEGHRARAFALFHWQWDVPGGEREFQRAIELNPNDPEAHHWYATALMALARYPEALEQIELARQLDPTSSSIAADRAVILISSGDAAQGIPILNQLETADPQFLSPHIYLADAYASEGHWAQSLDESELLASLSHDQSALSAARRSRATLEAGGPQAMLQANLAEQLADFQHGRADALSVANSYARLGQKQQALLYLQKSFQRHESGLIYLRVWKVFAILQDQPEFQDLLHHLDLDGSTSP